MRWRPCRDLPSSPLVQHDFEQHCHWQLELAPGIASKCRWTQEMGSGQSAHGHQNDHQRCGVARCGQMPTRAAAATTNESCLVACAHVARRTLRSRGSHLAGLRHFRRWATLGCEQNRIREKIGAPAAGVTASATWLRNVVWDPGL